MTRRRTKSAAHPSAIAPRLDPRDAADLWFDVGDSNSLATRHGLALFAFRNAARLAARAADPGREIAALLEIAAALSALGRVAEIDGVIESLHAIARRPELPAGLALQALVFARIATKAPKERKAFRYLLEGVREARRSKSTDELAEAWERLLLSGDPPRVVRAAP